MKKKYLLIILLILSTFSLSFFLIHKKTYIVISKTEFTPKELWDIQFQKKKDRRELGYNKADKPDLFTKYFKDITTKLGEDESAYKMNYQTVEFNKALVNSSKLKTNKTLLPWIQRGPANIGGRTRAILVDPDDATHNTWFAGSATGGIWKTTDGGNNWLNLSDNFTNLSVNALAMAQSNSNIIFAGTGESFPGGTYLKGNGIWKSVDKGINWVQLLSTSTNEEFAYINRLIIDPTDENTIIAPTEKGIFKSIDGGSSWLKTYNSTLGIEDLKANPTDFNNLFAGENSVGILKSNDAGDSWAVSSSGIGHGKRFEVTVSEVDPNYIYTSVEVSNTESSIYFSNDNGINWKRYNDTENFLGGQGGYDNAITPHPYIADEVFVGGVNIWKVKFNGSETVSTPEILKAYTVNTSFLSFINYGGPYLGGGMSADDGTNLEPTDWVSVEIRFGPGISQKAHRFTVPDGSTSGVPASSYTYEEYIDVPFEVWDITNNVQLMVSFRDQESDGLFNLYERTGDIWGLLGREYIFVNSVNYNETTPDANISTTGGHLFKNLYMFWPTLTEGEHWTPDNLPISKIVVEYGTISLMSGIKTSIANAYSWDGPNSYNQSAGFGNTIIPGLHPDHHNITIIPTGDPNFLMIDANDGGFGFSNDNGIDINQMPNNYITTQFYGVAKHPTENEYFGGMQDNGTWQSPDGEDASSTSHYFFRIGGDGFEALWNAEDPNLMLGSIYNNSIKRSTNKGLTWSNTTGITTGDGPFITRLSVSKENPDLTFAVRNSGLYRSLNFGLTWSKITISNNWAIDNIVSSSHNVEVSLANGKIVWAGGGMATDFGLQIQVSSDYGNTFSALNDFDLVSLDSYTSGIATHPTEENTAYVLFSLSDAPKILRTTDLGNSWTDISGFGTGDESNNGFPDVVTHCLLVMPHNPNILWVGTDIGLFESVDNGISWHIANNGLPPVSVYDMHIVGDQVVVATHGRGIWSVDILEIDNAPYISSFEHNGINTFEISSDFKVSYDSVQVFVNNLYEKTIITPSIGINNIGININVIPGNTYSSYIIGHISDQEFNSNIIELLANTNSISNNSNSNLKVYPNPSSGIFYFEFEELSTNFIMNIYNIKGQKVYSKKETNNKRNILDLSSLKKGSYFLQIVSDNKKYSKIIQIN